MSAAAGGARARAGTSAAPRGAAHDTRATGAWRARGAAQGRRRTLEELTGARRAGSAARWRHQRPRDGRDHRRERAASAARGGGAHAADARRARGARP